MLTNDYMQHNQMLHLIVKYITPYVPIASPHLSANEHGVNIAISKV